MCISFVVCTLFAFMGLQLIIYVVVFIVSFHRKLGMPSFKCQASCPSHNGLVSAFNDPILLGSQCLSQLLFDTILLLYKMNSFDKNSHPSSIYKVHIFICLHSLLEFFLFHESFTFSLLEEYPSFAIEVICEDNKILGSS